MFVNGSTNSKRKCCGGDRKGRQSQPSIPTLILENGGVRIEGDEQDRVITADGVVNYDASREHPRKEDDKLIEARRKICAECTQLVHDVDGNDTEELLRREIDGKHFCGDPNNPDALNDARRYGCGCEIEERTKWKQSFCPRGFWGPGAKFHSVFLPVIVKNDKDTVPATFDYVGPAHVQGADFLDYAGIGDTMQQSVIAQALQRKKHAEGINVRFTTVQNKIRWAKWSLRTTGMEILNISDSERRIGEYTACSSYLRMVELDATCEMAGLGRMPYIAKRLGLSPEDILSWEVSISEEHLGRAQDYLRVPLKEGRPVVALVPFANSGMRQWPLRHFHQLMDRLKTHGIAVYIIDAPRPKGHPVYQLPVKRFQSDDPEMVAAIIKSTDLVISNDSGMAHLAGYVGSKALAICGVTRGTTVFSGWPSVTPLQAPGECTGCSYYQDNGWKRWCSWGCNLMQNLEPRVVLARALGLIQ